MDTISVDYQGKVAIARLNRNVTNALNPASVQELGKLLGDIENNSDVHALVLGSSNDKFFSIGFDVPELLEYNKNDFRDFFRLFNRVCLELYTLPKPTVAAITGHAIAGGCIVALCCDYRFIAEGRKLMGLNEIKLGVPVPYLADRLLHTLTGVRQAREILEIGALYAPEETLAMGLVDEVLPATSVIEKAVEHAGRLGEMPEAAYAVIKQNRVEMTAAEVSAREPDKEWHFIECWFSDDTRVRLKEATEKF